MYQFLNTALSAVAIFVSVFVFKKRNKDILLAEKYKNLIFPMFDVLEPYLYKELSPDAKDALVLALNVHKHNKLYSSPNLNQAILMCEPVFSCSKSAFMALCKKLDHEYDICCQKLGLKRRSLYYRLNNRQYIYKWQAIAAAFFVLLRDLIVLAFIYVVVFCVLVIGLHILVRL